MKIKQRLLYLLAPFAMASLQGSDIKSDDTIKQLSKAIRKDNNKKFFKLIEKNKNCINIKTPSGKTLLMLAIRKKNINIVKKLLKEGADLSIKDKNDSNAYHYGAALGDLGIMEALVKADKYKKYIINEKNKDRKTPLILAAERGHDVIVELLLDNEANPSKKDNDLNNFLHSAIMEWHINVVRAFVKGNYENKLDILDAKNGEGKTPLILAAERGYDDIVELLLEKGANTNQKYKEKNFVYWAIIKGEIDVVRAFVEGKYKNKLDILAIINEKNHKGKTPLILAAQRGDEEIVKLLLDNEANTNEKYKNNNFFHWAVKNRKIKVVRAFVKGNYGNKLDIINAKNGEGKTPLSIAADNRNVQTAVTLIKHGADCSVLKGHDMEQNQYIQSAIKQVRMRIYITNAAIISAIFIIILTIVKVILNLNKQKTTADSEKLKKDKEIIELDSIPVLAR